jgi:dynein heavy chain
MILFIDDINMPVVNEWGDQVTLEIVRQLIEDGGFYMLERLNIGQQKLIQRLKYLAAMQHPGGGKNDIPNRAKRHFFIFNMVLPASIKEIFGPIIKYHFKEKHYSGEFNRVVDSLCQATIQLWNKVSTTMLRTPAKFHYVFNMRELSRVFKGILNVKKEVAKGALTLQGMKSHIFLIALWKHECERVFVDKLINIKDKNTVCDYIQEISFEAFSQHEGEIME